MLIHRQQGLKVSNADFKLENNIDLVEVPFFSEGVDNTGITLDLPYVGTYTIYFSVAIQHSGNQQFDNRWVVGYLYNDTTSSYVPNASAYLASMQNLAPNGDFWPCSGTIIVSYKTNSPCTIRLLTSRHSLNSNCVITNDYTHWGYTCIH